MGIQVVGVSKCFKEQYVLKNINVFFDDGKIHGIIGRNGSGKTVLLKSILGFIPIIEGSILINDKKIGKDVDIPERIGIIIETPGFLPNYSGYNNLKLLALIHNIAHKREIRTAMMKVGLDPDLKRHVGKYSLGMRQRLGIAQAIMEEPSILLLDEPLNGLDNQGADEMRKLFMALKKDGKTIILASHNKEDIDILCDSVYEMDKGMMRQVR